MVAHPLAAFLVRSGVTANGITLAGLLLTCAAAITLFGPGHLVAGAIVIALCTLFDLVDGAVARASGGGSPYGALVDAVSDRVADGVILRRCCGGWSIPTPTTGTRWSCSWPA